MSRVLIMLASVCGILPLAHAADCLSPAQLAQLETKELEYMLGRIPPAFEHAVKDKKISLQMLIVESSADGVCRVKERLTVPKEEIAEAEQLLEQDPAKRIILFSQGYGLPSSTTLEAVFTVDPSTREIAHRDTFQVGELGKVRADVEMMYAMLSQSRAGKSEHAEAIKPWSSAFILKNRQSCQSRFSSTGSLEQACGCRAQELGQRYSERRLEYLDYVVSNPYAQATGAAEDYSKQTGTINARCNLSKK